MDIEFATTEELISELTSRTTFVGMVIYSAVENRSPETVHNNFQIKTNIAPPDAFQVINHIATHINRGEYYNQDF
jgi:hypothetical protein